MIIRLYGTEPKYVVDASVAVQRLVRDAETPHVRTLFRLAGKEKVALWVPEFCFAECANVLWKAVRFQGMPPQRAAELVRDLGVAPLNVAAVVELLPRALELGLQHTLPIYDAVYIALAKAMRCPLITVDRRQAQTATAHGVPLKPITDFAPS